MSTKQISPESVATVISGLMVQTAEHASILFGFLNTTLNTVWHPDTQAAELVGADLQPLFTAEQAAAIDAKVSQAFSACERDGVDIYEVALDAIK